MRTHKLVNAVLIICTLLALLLSGSLASTQAAPEPDVSLADIQGTGSAANSWTVATSPTTNWLRGLAMVSSTDGWAVGDGGTILRWNGNVWTTAASPTTDSLNSVAMVSSTDGWAVGGADTALRWNGSAWMPVAGPASYLHSVAMVSSTDGWAVGSRGTILHYTSAYRIFLPVVLRNQ